MKKFKLEYIAQDVEGKQYKGEKEIFAVNEEFAKWKSEKTIRLKIGQEVVSIDFVSVEEIPIF